MITSIVNSDNFCVESTIYRLIVTYLLIDIH